MANIQVWRENKIKHMLTLLLAQAEGSHSGERFPSLRRAPFA